MLQTHTKKPKAIRAFAGLAGSALSTVTPLEEIPIQQPPPPSRPASLPPEPRRGRPRKWINDADKQAGYRDRRDAKQIDAARLEEIKQIIGSHPPSELHPNHGSCMPDAPSGRGRLVTGGYNERKLSQVDTAHVRGQAGNSGLAKPVAPKGYGSDADENADFSEARPEEKLETEDQFVRNKKFPNFWGLSTDETAHLVRDFIRDHIDSPVSSLDPNWETDIEDYPMIPLSHSCQLCSGRFDRRIDAADHIEKKHSKDIHRWLRENKPKQLTADQKSRYQRDLEEYRNKHKAD